MFKKILKVMLLTFGFVFLGFIRVCATEYYSDPVNLRCIKREIFNHFGEKRIFGYDIIQNYLRDKKTGKIVEIKESEKESITPITKKQLKTLFRGIEDLDPIDFRKIGKFMYEIQRPYSQVYLDLNLIKEIMEEIIEEKKTEKEKLITFYLCFEELFELFEKNFLEIFNKNNLYKRAPEEYGGNVKEEELKYGARNKDEEKIFRKLEIVRTPMYSFGEEQYEYCKYFKEFVYMFLRDNVKFNSENIEVLKYKVNQMRRFLVFDIDKVNSYLGMRLVLMIECLKLLDSMYEKFLDFTKNMKDKSLLNLKFAEKILFKKTIGEKIENWQEKVFYECSIRILRENFLIDDVKDMEEFFNPNQTIEELASYLKEILESLNLPKEEIDAVYSYYLNFIDGYTKKIVINSSVLNNIRKAIDLRKEIMPIIERITQKEVYENIISTIMSFVDEEPKIMKEFDEKVLKKMVK